MITTNTDTQRLAHKLVLKHAKIGQSGADNLSIQGK